MRLFIAEKPSLGAAIADVLPGVKSKRGTHIVIGNNDVVTWARGHLYELREPQDYDDAWTKSNWQLDVLPMVPTVWKRKPKRDAKEQIAAIKQLLEGASVVVNAGDPDREGQLIVDELLEELKNKKPVKRLWLNATDEASVSKALANLRDNAAYRGLRDSAEARSCGDWLIGMNLTRLITLLGQKAGANGVWSVGRVQTPTLALVVKRDSEIESFRPKAFFDVRATIAVAAATFGARWVPCEGTPLDEAGRVLDRALAEAVAAKVAGKLATVQRFEAKDKTEAHPLTFSLNELQMETNRRLSLSAQQTLEAAQRLYEAKVASYPRTDCGYLPESQLGAATRILEGLRAIYPVEVAKAKPAMRSRTWNDARVTAHHGIVPTGVVTTLADIDAQVYDLIVRRYLAQFYDVHEYRDSSAELVVEGETFTASGKVIVKAGWCELFSKGANAGGDGDDEAAADPVAVLPALAVGQVGKCERAVVEAKKTKPPERFTDGKLIGAMINVHKYESDPEVKKWLRETAGIGTSATRAGIIETLKKRGFIEGRDKQLVSTARGRELIGLLEPEMKSPGLTAMFEEMLDAVATGKLTKAEFLARKVEFLTRMVKAPLRAAFKPAADLISCPRCKSGHLRQRRGPTGVFWGCSRYPDCRATVPDAKGKPALAPVAAGAAGRARAVEARR